MNVNREEKILVLALILEFNCYMFLNNADFRELSDPYVWKIEGILKIPASWEGNDPPQLGHYIGRFLD